MSAAVHHDLGKPPPRKTASGVSSDDLAILASLDTEALLRGGERPHPLPPPLKRGPSARGGWAATTRRALAGSAAAHPPVLLQFNRMPAWLTCPPLLRRAPSPCRRAAQGGAAPRAGGGGSGQRLRSAAGGLEGGVATGGTRGWGRVWGCKRSRMVAACTLRCLVLSFPGAVAACRTVRCSAADPSTFQTDRHANSCALLPPAGRRCRARPAVGADRRGPAQRRGGGHAEHAGL